MLEEAENSKTINSQLDLIKQKLGQAFLMLQIQEDPFEIDDVYKIYSGSDTNKEMGVVAVYVEHNTYYKKLVGKDLKKVSWQKFENTKGHLQDFIKWKYKQQDIKLSKLKFQFIKDFEYYLRTEKEMQQSTINKTLQRFKNLINFAIAHEYLDRNPFLLHSPKPTKKEVVYLTKSELAHLQNKKIDIRRLEEVRDCFFFCCYTGLLFEEMSNLRQEHIVKGKDEKNWIKMKRQKTNKNMSVPILPVPRKIMDKYKGHLTEGRFYLSKLTLTLMNI